MQTRVTSIFGIKYPIVQGGLAYLAYSDLAAAVSNAGGLGQITAMSLKDPDKLRHEIRKVRNLTDKPFGVNFAIGRQYEESYKKLLKVAIEEKVPAVSITGGNPVPIFERLKGENIRTLVLVANTRQAQKAEQLGADAIMAVGHEGGGHLGLDEVGTMVLIPRVVESVSIPVLASGGIGDARGFLAALSLGAEGVEMGTRFIATKECVHAGEAYKRAILQGKETDTVIIKKSLRSPGRVLRSDYTEGIIAREKEGATYEDLREQISGKANCEYIHNGNEKEGFGWAGQVIGLVNEIPTVKELIDEIITGAEKGRKRLDQIFG
jgi:enoyl-[acyl-carrier protein] reductase II